MAKLISRLSKIAAAAPLVAGEALIETGEAVLSLTKQLAPVDTGTLRDSFEMEVEKDRVTIGTNVSYAVPVEYGSSRSAAQPSLTPAMAQSEETFKTVLKRKMSELK